ncbi:MAG TPA: hypothetical protein P5347_03535 [Smithellaceae bacterium]|nr:hypothetical protein [Smithellaceae bacterium]
MIKKLTKILVVFISILSIAGTAFAGEICASKADAKKLAAAETSFMRSCEADTKAANAQASREANTKDKNMVSVAKYSLLQILFGQHKI